MEAQDARPPRAAAAHADRLRLQHCPLVLLVQLSVGESANETFYLVAHYSLVLPVVFLLGGLHLCQDGHSKSRHVGSIVDRDDLDNALFHDVHCKLLRPQAVLEALVRHIFQGASEKS